MSEQENEIISFLMIGQSNMAGRGALNEVPPIRNQRCFMLRMGIWQHMSEPINPDVSVFEGKYRSGISLAASFADEYARYYNNNIGLIPCAVGNTQISQWQPGEILFDNAVMNARLAMRTSRLGGIIWHQGESDCKNFEPEKYAENLIFMVEELRRQLDAPDVPFIMGEISEKITEKWGLADNPPKMNRLLHGLKEKISCCEVASSKDLTLKDDGVHFDSVSCRELGKRYFEKYLDLHGIRKK